MSIFKIGQKVIAKTIPGEVQDTGRIIAYQDAPTYTIERSDGTRFSWRANLCRHVKEDCPTCEGRGFILPKPSGNLNRDLAVIICPRCAE